MLQTLATDEVAIKALKQVGPEVFCNAPNSDFIGDLLAATPVAQSIGDQVVCQVSDEDPSTIDPQARFDHHKFYPAGGSFQSVNHFKQLLVTGEFKKYDYGSEDLNQKHHGQPTPPAYDIENIENNRIMLVCGKQDLLASPVDYKWLAWELEKRNDVDFKEYDLGHLGLMMPVDKTNIDDILKKI